MLDAIITLSCDGDTFSHLKTFTANLDRYAIPDDTRLLDGGHAHLAGNAGRALDDFGDTTGAVRRFVTDLTAAGVDDDATINYGSDIAVDLQVYDISDIYCGEHKGGGPENLLVIVHPGCVHD